MNEKLENKSCAASHANLLTNYHTHSTFCDGKDSPETMVKYAIAKGFTHLGFSAHALYPFASDWHLPVKDYERYVAEIKRLSSIYSDKIEIYTGFEADYFPPLTTPDRAVYSSLGADYIIGSTHYLAKDTSTYAKSASISKKPAGIPFTCFTIDGPVEEVAGGINNLFGGDGKKTVQAYFSEERDMLRTSSFDIIGHIDLIRKRNGILRFFDETEEWYKNELEETAKTVANANVIVEINTGGIARGAINDVYPSKDFLMVLNKYGVPIMLNSDAHNGEDLDCAFSMAKTTAIAAGFREFVYYTKGSWKSRPIK